MATSELDNLPRLAPDVPPMLDALRARIRRYVWLEGLSAAAAWLGLAFWASLAIDWLFEPPVPVRAVVLVIAGIGLAAVVTRFIGRRAFVPLSQTNMATVLERRFPQLDDSLLTSVVLAGRAADESGFDPRMLARTCRQAQQRLAGITLPEVFNPMPLRRKAVIALCLAAVIAGLAAWAPDTLATWVQRDLLLGERLWPRKIRLDPVGFVDGAAKVASGADFNLVVQARPGDTDPWVLPEAVEVRYQIEGGARGRRTMDNLGVGSVAASAAREPGDEVLREYGYTFHGVLAPIRFYLVGGDVRPRPYLIAVVPNPTLTRLELEYVYPAYMDRPPRTMPVAGAMAVPLGTRLTVYGRANKELEWVRVDAPAGRQQASGPRWLKGRALGPDHARFALDLPALERDTTLLFALMDTDGIKSREPIPLALVAVPDEPPQVAVRLTGIGSAITPSARLPLVGRITDDYGIAKVWFEHAADKQKPVATAVAAPPKHPAELPLEKVALEVGALGLARGQRLSVSLKAADLCDLSKTPNVGASETWVLDVVSPDELRAMLEARELVLRQRFEAIIEEMTETRTLVARLDFSPSGTAGGPTAGKPVAKKAAGAEPGEQPAAPQDLSPAEAATRRTERVLQALQNCRKNAQETLGVAEAVDDIRLQLANNRIDTEELKNRLGAGIAEPLHRIAEQMFAELDRRLESLQAATADLAAGTARRDAARQQADDILLAMHQVLSRMIELEDFNELVERLRTIIQLQEQIENQTKLRHKQRIHELEK